MNKSSSLQNLAWRKTPSGLQPSPIRSGTGSSPGKETQGLLPVIIQDDRSGRVLMLGYMDKAALEKSVKTGNVWFYSRSKKRLWMKGESSENVLIIRSMIKDCDADALLIRVIPAGPTCHTGKESCFDDHAFFLRTTENVSLSFGQLYRLIEERKKDKPAGSYTAQLFRKGLSKISGKVIEEAIEVVQAATRESDKRLTEESVDLLYHLFVLLAARGIAFKRLEREMRRRHAESGRRLGR